MNSIEVIRTPEIVATEINSIKEQTRNILLFNSIEIGRRLTEAKSMMEHGEFGKWLASAVDYSQSTANNLMKIYEQYGADQGALFGDNAKSQTFGNLSYSQAVALLGIPAEEREQFVQDNNAAELSIRELKEKIKEYAENERELTKRADELRNKFYEADDKAKAETAKVDKLITRLDEKDNEILALKTRANKAETRAQELDAEQKNYAKARKEFEADYKKRIAELEAELNKPATVETAVVEKVPDDVQRELEALRAAVKEKPVSDNDVAVKAEITLLFATAKDSFNRMLEAVAKLEDKELRSKYYGAVGKLAGMVKKIAEDGENCVA